MPLGQFFHYLGVSVNGQHAEGKHLVLNWQFTDTGQRCVLTLRNAVLTADFDAHDEEADATVTLSRATLDEISLQRLTFPAALSAGRIAVQGRSPARLLELLGLLDTFAGNFAIVEPRPHLAPSA
jgi:alkyl sulfatase BDS1-like metallo-beta-lactamase superfamily hydrolase